jgi:hypothetical protein
LAIWQGRHRGGAAARLRRPGQVDPDADGLRDGVLVFSQRGALSAAELEQLIRAVRDIDMDDVGQDIAAQQTDRSA